MATERERHTANQAIKIMLNSECDPTMELVTMAINTRVFRFTFCLSRRTSLDVENRPTHWWSINSFRLMKIKTFELITMRDNQNWTMRAHNTKCRTLYSKDEMLTRSTDGSIISKVILQFSQSIENDHNELPQHCNHYYYNPSIRKDHSIHASNLNQSRYKVISTICGWLATAYQKQYCCLTQYALT